MKAKYVRKALAVLALVSMVGTGCTKNNAVSENSVSEDTLLDLDGTEKILTIHNVSVTVNDFRVYLLQYATSADLTADNAPDAERLKAIDLCLVDLEKDVTDCQKALEKGIVLDDSMQQKIENYVKGFQNYYGEECLKTYGITEDVLRTHFTRKAYAYKVKEATKTNVYKLAYGTYEAEYADLTFTKIYSVYFPTVAVNEAGDFITAADGSYEMLSETEIADIEVKARELKERSKTESLEDLAVEYQVNMYSGDSYLYEGGYGEEMKAYIKDLKEGDISDVIPMDVGYLVLRIDDEDDEQYKLNMLDYLANNDATTAVEEEEKSWLREYNVNGDILNVEVIASIDLSAMCQDLKDRGLFEEGVVVN